MLSVASDASSRYRWGLLPAFRVAPLLLAFASSGCAIATGPALHAVAAPPALLHARSLTFDSRSGSTIHAWLADGRAGAGAVLLLHGVGADRTSMGARAVFLHDCGFTVLAPDFQAHGESPGEHITFGARESLDAAGAMDYLRAHDPDDRIGVIGVSMGGAATLLGDGPLAADAFVLESVYPSIRQAVSDRLATWLGPMRGLAPWVTSSALDLITLESGVTEAQLEPIARIGHLGAPLLLLSGTADPYTPIAEAESLFVRAPAPKEFWPVSGATHEDLYAYAPREYERRVGDFLVANLRPASRLAGRAPPEGACRSR